VSPVSRGRKPPKSGRSGKPVRRSPAFGAVPGTSRPREPTFLAARDEVIKSLAKLVDAEVAASAYEAEALGSVVLGFLIAPGLPEDAIVRIVLDVIDELERRNAASTYTALCVLAVVGPPGTTEYAAQTARRVASRQGECVSQPSWIADLGNVTPGACHLAASPAGDQTVVSCAFIYANGTKPHLVWATLDHAWHGAPSILVMAEDPAEASAMMKKYAREDGAEVREVPAAEAARLLLAGIGALIEHGPPPEGDRKDKFFSESCSSASLARSRLALLLGPDEKAPGRIKELWPADESARLVAEFLAAPQANALADPVSRTMPKLLVSLTVNSLGCDPRVLSVKGLTRILLRIIPAITVAPDSFGVKIPPVTRAWAEWLAEQRGLSRGTRRRINRDVERLLRQFPAHWNGPLASPLRRYVQDVPDEVACDGDLLMPLLERREFAVPLPENRANGVVQSTPRSVTRHTSEFDAASASDRALITVNDLNGRGVPQDRFDSYVAVVEQLWTDDPQERWVTAKRMLATGKSRTAVLDRLARDHGAANR
jgi:hypothetical protein